MNGDSPIAPRAGGGALNPPFPPVHIQADGLACERGSRLILSDISFSLTSGELLALTGPNGSGKSSLLRLLAGLLRPAAGQFLIGRSDQPSVSRDQMDGEGTLLHYFGHSDALKPSLTLRDNLTFWHELYGGDDPDLFDVAARVSLDHALDLPSRVLSAGQLRRAGLARLLLSPRPLWLLDEPTSALDRDGEGLLGEIMTDHMARGGLIIAATHAALPVQPTSELNLGLSS